MVAATIFQAISVAILGHLPPVVIGLAAFAIAGLLFCIVLAIVKGEGRGMWRDYGFSQVETFLRKWPWLHDERGQYDSVGCLTLFRAILENLTENCLDAELESYFECYAEDKEKVLSPKQRKFLERVLELDGQL
jgi:hypothetical protein